MEPITGIRRLLPPPCLARAHSTALALPLSLPFPSDPDASHANLAAAAPIIPVSRPSFSRVPPGIHALYPSVKTQWYVHSWIEHIPGLALPRDHFTVLASSSPSPPAHSDAIALLLPSLSRLCPTFPTLISRPNRSFQTVIFPGSPGYALHPVALVMILWIERIIMRIPGLAHARAHSTNVPWQ